MPETKMTGYNNNRLKTNLVEMKIISPEIDVSSVPELLNISKTLSKKKMEVLGKIRRLFYIKKWDIKNICDSLDLSRKTIYNYLKLLREIHDQVAQTDGGIVADVNRFLWDITSSYEERVKKLWQALTEASNSSVKTSVLREIREQEAQHVMLLQDLGFLPKAVKKSFTASVTYVSHLGKKKEKAKVVETTGEDYEDIS